MTELQNFLSQDWSVAYNTNCKIALNKADRNVQIEIHSFWKTENSEAHKIQLHLGAGRKRSYGHQVAVASCHAVSDGSIFRFSFLIAEG